MITTLPDSPTPQTSIQYLNEAFGAPFHCWARCDGNWLSAEGNEPAAEELTPLLDTALGQAEGAVVRQGPCGKQWIAIRLDGSLRAKVVAAAPLTSNAQDYATRLATHVNATAHANFQHEDQQELLEGYASKLTDSFEELTFLRRLSRHVEYCDASRSLAEVSLSVLPELARLMAVDGIALLEARHDAAGPCVGPIVASEGRIPYTNDVWQAKVQELAAQGRKVIVRNFTGLHESCSFLCGVRSIVLAELNKEGHVFGWLLGINKKHPTTQGAPSNSLDHDEIGSMEASLLESAAAMLATHAANERLFREKETLTIETIHTLVGVIEARDAYTCGHSDRVALVARRLANELGLPQEECHGIYLAGLLHDIGKVGISDDVLLKPGKLSDEEFDLIKQHPKCGYKLLERLAALGNLLPGVLHHHENYDGRGYPHGLAGEDIPLTARILAVSDAWDAMTSDRPYRPGMPWEKAMSILREGAGSQWDPQVVDAFFAIIEEVKEITLSWEDHLQGILKPAQNKTLTMDFQASLTMANPVISDVGL